MNNKINAVYIIYNTPIYIWLVINNTFIVIINTFIALIGSLLINH